MRYLLLLSALALTGCDQFFPYDKEPVQVCGPLSPIYADDGSGVLVGYTQVCITEYQRSTTELVPCTTDSDCAEKHPGTNGDPIPVPSSSY